MGTVTIEITESEARRFLDAYEERLCNDPALAAIAIALDEKVNRPVPGFEAMGLPIYTTESAITFVSDMMDAGLDVEHYHGRYFWEGPAVRVDDLQEAVSATRVQVQWDNMGLGYIVYPVRPDAGQDA